MEVQGTWVNVKAMWVVKNKNNINWKTEAVMYINTNNQYIFI